MSFTVWVIAGLDSLSFDMKESTLTVIGDADPVCVANLLRKKFRCAEVVYAGTMPPPREPTLLLVTPALPLSSSCSSQTEMLSCVRSTVLFSMLGLFMQTSKVLSSMLGLFMQTRNIVATVPASLC
jgi:hypothetical protein